ADWQDRRCNRRNEEADAEILSAILNIISDMPSYGYRRGFAPIFPDICYHLTHYKPAAADIPVASDNPAHYADA
ncbi:hypothetical protein, partial [Escherichia coli]|uniref:hypothetical protein n=1 Tax=Escherichia coli TaxID=562 RepID=UPI001EFAF486